MARTAPLNRFKITSPELPGAVFYSYEDFRDNAAIALIAHTAIQEFTMDGCQDPLAETLRDRCGWDDESIMAAIRNPRKPLAIAYGWPANYGTSPIDPQPASPWPVVAGPGVLDKLREFVGCAVAAPALA